MVDEIDTCLCCCWPNWSKSGRKVDDEVAVVVEATVGAADVVAQDFDEKSPSKKYCH